MIDSLITARQTAAEALAAAAVDLFPKTLLIQGAGTDNLFFYDFIFSSPFQPEMLALLEESLRVKLKQRPQIRVLEMIPKNAALRMEHQGQWIRRDQLRQAGRGLVNMIEIDGFVDWCEAPFEAAWDPRLQLKLIEAYPIEMSQGGDGRSGIRIIGVLFSEKDQLKEFLKTAPRFEKLSHLIACKALHLCTQIPSLGEGLFAWLPNGEKVCQKFIDWWKQAHREQNFQLIATPASLIAAEGNDPGEALTQAHSQVFSAEGISQLAEIAYLAYPLQTPIREGLLDVAGAVSDRAHWFCPDEELLSACISSLHFIIKMPKILCFEFEILLYTSSGGAQKKGAKGLRLFQQALKECDLRHTVAVNPNLEEGESRIVLRLIDSLGRKWDGPFLSVCGLPQRQAGYMLLKRSAFGMLERFIALFLEQKQGRAWKSVDDLMNALNWSKDSELAN